MSKEYYPTIGLEIHVELKTQSKMFCGCSNNPDEKRPNVNICPVCLAHPGTLPVINKKAVESVIKVGTALNGKIADFTEFDRKNYFYPDIPKGYQISQYKFPIVKGGELSGIKITRIHLEEDTATSKHPPERINQTSNKEDYTLIDFNRAGVPLMELVTEPVIHSAKEAVIFAKELQLLLRYLNVSEANMEKGQMRVELNISISDNPDKFGTKVEVKNINSFRAVEKAADFEIKRMTELLEKGQADKIIQETRGWNEYRGETFSQRSKENANDYRYFPDPDLPKLFLSKIFNINKIKEELSELPKERRERYKNKYQIKDEDIESFVVDKDLGDWFETVANKFLKDNDLGKIKIASNYLTSDYLGLKKNNLEVRLPKVEYFVELINMIANNEITSRGAKDILLIITLEDKSPFEIAKEKKLIQNNDKSALKDIIEKVIKSNPSIVDSYKSGKENVIMFLVGQVMNESSGSANPTLVQKLLKELIK